MSAESVGQIGLDLVVNKNDFQRQMGGIQKLAAKAGKALAAAFAVKKIVEFGASCLELGSDLQEVQNVVDVTFPSMKKQVNEFAQSAAASFGLSETMAKKFTGTFGAMAKSFGFSESAAHDMSTALTGLAGDVASFYNITQDEAYTKLKSVFTGETESLKELGVVMTQTALDSYALAKGIGKTTAKMTEAEKVALRYKFVQEQLSAASGDFIRTSDGWANQVRVLKLQFDSLKATIGQGLINVLTPVIKVINTLVGKLMTLANAFKSFTEMITGRSGTGEAAAQMHATATAADAAAASTKAVGDAAASSAKKMKGLFAFDEMNVMPKDSETGGAGGYKADSFDMGKADMTAVDEVDSKYQKLLDKAKELAGLFKQGFQFGLGDTGVFDSIGQKLASIKDSFLSIFTSQEVLGACDNFLQTFAENAGVSVGAFVSIGASVADNLLGGISGYMENNSTRISEYIVSMFDIGSRIAEIKGNVNVALATIAESLRSEGAVRITESLVGCFANAFMGITELCGNLAVDLLEVITGPFVDNQDLIRTTLEETFTAVAPVFESIKEAVDECATTMQTAYDEHIAPMLETFRNGFSQLGTTLLTTYNDHFLPVIEGMSARFSEFKDQYLSPLIEKFGEMIGKIATALETVWVNYLQPYFTEFIEKWYPVIAEVIGIIGNIIFDLGAGIAETLEGVMTAFGGLMDFITGVFAGDWSLALTGIKDFAAGIWQAITSNISAKITAAYNCVKSVGTKIHEALTEKFTAVRNFASDTMTRLYDGISNGLNRIKNTWSVILANIKSTTQSIFTGIWDTIKNTINSILSGIEGMTNGIIRGLNGAINALNSINFSVPSWVPELGGKSFSFSVPNLSEISIPRLAQGGYVKANTPQLAMIGDNRHQGEIVAPEDKIYQISAQAMKDVMQPFMATLSALAGNVQGKSVTVVLKVTGEMAPLVRLLKAEFEKEDSRTGVNFEVVYE